MYNPHAKEWQTVNNGEVQASFPSGPKGKRDAQFEALACDCRLIYNEIHMVLKAHKNHSEILEITKRAVKAGYLLRDGHLLPPRALSEPGSYVNEIATVRSQREPEKIYAICDVNKLIWCSCPDHQEGLYRAKFRKQNGYSPGAPALATGQVLDKHILAYLFDLVINLYRKEQDNA